MQVSTSPCGLWSEPDSRWIVVRADVERGVDTGLRRLRRGFLVKEHVKLGGA